MFWMLGLHALSLAHAINVLGIAGVRFHLYEVLLMLLATVFHSASFCIGQITFSGHIGDGKRKDRFPDVTALEQKMRAGNSATNSHLSKPAY
jgi:hypothetical protein